ncbi:hypothetical protein BH708_14725 [Brachybacterium sp. P6-10-X1]|uniref:hypothetical protein n=1 Tax=Brachybacterium sp. P6-10-X1 TaxID=1903186 RepID=UPI00097183F0|nr:hypothetical protein [Brachybacterium sp. P6-10-X1]APX33757.1 hypothetical protein BH708_14725 [Brachybacterium sp. P6-10-X1]
MKRRAGGAVLAQAVQALVSLSLQILVIRLLGVAEYGRFAILYGVIVLTTAVITGLVGDSLVVLDRSDRRVRAGLELVLAVAVTLLAVGAGLLTLGSGFGSGLESVVFAAALFAFGVEEVVRRLLMAHMSFVRAALADSSSFVVVLVVVLAAHLAGQLSLPVVFAGIAAGQLLASGVGWRFVPHADRVLVGMRGARWREVIGYGSWRALQQVLRPGLFTVVRLVVLAAAGAAAVGLLEAARTYASPLILVVGGLSSFLFVRFADQKKTGAPGSVRDADRVVGMLVLAAIIMSGIAVVLIPWASPLLFGVRVNSLAVMAWLAYGTSVAFVTPYGALGAVAGRQVAIFAIRLGDTLLAVIVVLVLLALGAPVATVPFGLAAASLIGGLCLRRLVSSPGVA